MSPRQVTPGQEPPIKVTLEVWPELAQARGSFTRDGKTHDIEISSVYVKMLLAFLKEGR